MDATVHFGMCFLCFVLGILIFLLLILVLVLCHVLYFYFFSGSVHILSVAPNTDTDTDTDEPRRDQIRTHATSLRGDAQSVRRAGRRSR